MVVARQPLQAVAMMTMCCYVGHAHVINWDIKHVLQAAWYLCVLNSHG